MSERTALIVRQKGSELPFLGVQTQPRLLVVASAYAVVGGIPVPDFLKRTFDVSEKHWSTVGFVGHHLRDIQ